MTTGYWTPIIPELTKQLIADQIDALKLWNTPARVDLITIPMILSLTEVIERASHQQLTENVDQVRRTALLIIGNQVCSPTATPSQPRFHYHDK